jgi:hypothetical protein
MASPFHAHEHHDRPSPKVDHLPAIGTASARRGLAHRAHRVGGPERHAVLTWMPPSERHPELERILQN